MEEERIYLCKDLDDLFKTYYSIGALVRTEGLLSLENVVNTLDTVPVLFQIGAELICDGHDPGSNHRMLESLIGASDFTAEEKTVAQAMVEGLLSIQKGDDPAIIMVKMAKSLGVFRFARYAHTKGSTDVNHLTLFGQPFDFSASSPYACGNPPDRDEVPVDYDLEKQIVSFLNCTELARRDGLIDLHKVISKATDAPEVMNEILDWCIQTRNFDELPQMLDKTLGKREHATLSEAVVEVGVRGLFQGMGPRYLLNHLAALVGVQKYHKVMALYEKNSYGSTFYFGVEYQRPTPIKTFSAPAETVEYRNRGQGAPGYEDFDVTLAQAAMGEAFEQYEAIDVFIPSPIPLALMASAIHVLDHDYVFDVFAHHADSEAFKALKEAYENDASNPQTHVRSACYIADVMMGGDGAEYR